MMRQRFPKLDTEKLNKLKEDYLKAQEAKNVKVEEVKVEKKLAKIEKVGARDLESDEVKRALEKAEKLRPRKF